MFFGKSSESVYSVRENKRAKVKRNLPAGHNVIMMQGAPCKLINEGMTCAALNDK